MRKQASMMELLRATLIMPLNLPRAFELKLNRLLISTMFALLLVSCATTRNYFFHSYHIDETQKAAYLHELVDSLYLSKEEKLVFGLYGNWGYSLTPIDLDHKVDGACMNIKVRQGQVRHRKDIVYYNFFSDVFERDIHIMSKIQNDCGYELYLEQFVEHPKLNDAVHLALIRFREISERLEALHFSRLDLLEKYDDVDELVIAVDEDVRSLSEAGFQLAQSTKEFFQLAKIQLVMQDIVQARREGLSNLTSFSESLEHVKDTQYATIEEATLATIKALEGLQQDISN